MIRRGRSCKFTILFSCYDLDSLTMRCKGSGEAIDLERRMRLITYFEPIQFLDPVENGRKASFSSLSKRESYRGWVDGSQRSGWNTSGSTKLLGELDAAKAGIEIVAWRSN